MKQLLICLAFVLASCTSMDIAMADRLTPTVVELRSEATDTYFCTGVAVGPTTVRTAAHCQPPFSFVVVDHAGVKYKVLKLTPVAGTDGMILDVQNVSRGLKYAPVGDSRALLVGERVMSIGHPVGYKYSVTWGQIAHVARVDDEGKKYFQHTAITLYGSSGGPIFNMRGEVIGLTHGGVQGTIFLATPIHEVLK